MLKKHGLISENDHTLYRIASTIEEALEEIVGFYWNYHSIRFVDGLMHMRIKRRLPDADFAAIAKDFSYLASDGFLEQSGPSVAEQRDNDNLALTRVVLKYSGKGYASVRPLIDALNRY